MKKYLLFSVLVVVLVGTAACSQRPTFADDDSFAKAQKEDGWLIVGRFGDAWPARITSWDESYGEITFVDHAGTEHEYTGFEGYDLCAVKLRGTDGKEIIRVLRSTEMTGIVTDPLRD